MSMDKQTRIKQIRANFPPELLQLNQWVCWRMEEREGKSTKVPYVAGSPNQRAESNKPSTWSPFEQACKSYLSGNFDGVSFAFSEHDPYTGVDLDKCVNNGVIQPMKLAYIEALDSYTEFSQSGAGIHVIARGTLPPDGRKSTKHDIEMYESGRFFVVTGAVISGFPRIINERQTQIETVHALIFPPKPRQAPSQSHAGSIDIPADDQTLLNLMFASKNGAKIESLWNGFKNGYGDDESSADLALCNHLAFWTGNDAGRMDRMFRQSRLYRDKWDRNARSGETYGAGTISRAIAATLETYTPPSTKGRVYTGGANGYNHMPEDEPTTTETEKPEPKKTREASAAPKSYEYLEVLDGMGYRFEMNQLDDRIEVNALPISDGIQAEIRTRMRDLGYNKIKAFEDAYLAHAYKESYHPVRRYLSSLVWHGTDYIGLVADHMQSTDKPILYTDGHTQTVFYAYFRRWLIGAVERAMNGKQHPMLVLVAAQGSGKSQFVRWVGGGLPDLFIEEAIKPDNKEHDRLLAIKWVWEVGELGATTKRQDVEALKNFLTKQGVTFRVPWGTNPVTKPSLASFIGTVNPSTGFLTDITGNRRFTIAEISNIDWRYATLDANQLWAQAYQLFKDGERSELSPEEAERQVISNKEHLIEDPYEGWIRRYCDIDPLREDWSQTTTDLTALLQEQGIRGETRAIQMRLADTLKGMGVRQHANDRPRRWLGITIKPYFDRTRAATNNE